MANRVFYDEDARRRLLEGARILYEAVKTTMGPKGRNVVFEEFGSPKVTHDGVTVAKNIAIEERDDESLGYKTGAELIKQAANKMNDVAGDGTTTVTVLTYHILNEANKLIAAGHDPMLLRKGLEAAAQDVLRKLDNMAEDIKANKKRVAEVATISAGDGEIGNLIADVIEKVGKDGVVTVEEGQSLELEQEVVEGFTMKQGFVSPFMATDTTRMEAVIDKPTIIITDKKISSAQEFLPVLEQLAQAGKKDVLIVAEDVEGEVLGVLILNKLKGVLNAVAVKAPSYGDNRKAVLEDLAILTGGQVISEERGDTFENIDMNYFGSARKVIVTKDDTTVIEGHGTTGAIKSRISQIAAQAETADTFDRDQLNDRRAALQGKVAVIKVGGATETEIEEKKFRVDDAVAATKAALEEGVVPGGGVTLVNLADTKITGEGSYFSGSDLLLRALEQPFRIILENSGENADAWLPQVKKAKLGMGIDVTSPDKLVDLKAAGVIDPKRVTREAIQNAVSIAGTAMTMGALIAEVPKKEETSTGAMPGGLNMM